MRCPVSESPFPTLTELSGFQATAELGMVDTCTIRRQTGTTVDQNTGAETPTWGTIYTGPCKVRIGGGNVGGSGSGHDIGQQLVVTTTFVLSVPVTAMGIEERDVATIDSSLDADLTGRTLQIQAPFGQTYSTARRFACEESTL